MDHCRNPSKDNIVIIVRKHTTPENDKYHNFPYYISRIQRRKWYVKLRWLERHFPDHEVIVEIDNPNSIHAFNRLKDRLRLSSMSSYDPEGHKVKQISKHLFPALNPVGRFFSSFRYLH